MFFSNFSINQENKKRIFSSINERVVTEGTGNPVDYILRIKESVKFELQNMFTK